jgi:hypothetical protein
MGLLSLQFLKHFLDLTLSICNLLCELFVWTTVERTFLPFTPRLQHATYRRLKSINYKSFNV